MKELISVIQLHAKPECHEKLENTLKSLAESTYAEPGCLLYALHRDKKDPSVFVLIERWESQQSLDAHFASPHFKSLFPVIAELVSTPPDIRDVEPIGIATTNKARLL